MNEPMTATGGATPVQVRAYEAGTLPLSAKALNQLNNYFRELIAQTQKGGKYE